MHYIQFMLIFRYARDGTLEVDGLKKIAATCNVAEEGVKGAKDYFEARVKEVWNHEILTRCCPVLNLIVCSNYYN